MLLEKSKLNSEETYRVRSQRIKWFIKLCFGGNSAEFARTLDITPGALQYYLTGKRRPGSSILDRFHTAGLDPNWVMYGAFEPFSDSANGIELKRRFGHLVKDISEDLNAMEPILPSPDAVFPALKKLLSPPIRDAFNITDQETQKMIEAFYDPRGVEAFEFVVAYLMKKREEQYRAMSQVKGNDQ